MKHQPRRAPPGGDRDPAHEAQLPQAAALALARPRGRRRGAAAGLHDALLGDVGACDLAARDNATGLVDAPGERASADDELERERRARTDGAAELDHRQAWRIAERRAQNRLDTRRFEHFGEKGDAGQDRLPGEMAGECRMVGRDHERSPERRTVHRRIAPLCCASSARRAAVSLPVVSRGRAGDADDPARQERGVDALAQRGADLLVRQARRDDESHQADDAERVAARLGRHPERAVDDAVDRVELEVEMADRAALAGDVDQVVGPAEQAEGIAAGDLEHVGEQRRLRHVAAAHRDRVAVAGEADAVEGLPLGPAVVRRDATWPASVQP